MRWGHAAVQGLYFIVASDSGKPVSDSLPASGLEDGVEKLGARIAPNPRVAFGVNVLGFIAGGMDGLLGEMRRPDSSVPDLLRRRYGRALGFTDQLFSNYGLTPRIRPVRGTSRSPSVRRPRRSRRRSFQQVPAPRLTISAFESSASREHIGYSGRRQLPVQRVSGKHREHDVHREQDGRPAARAVGGEAIRRAAAGQRRSRRWRRSASRTPSAPGVNIDSVGRRHVEQRIGVDSAANKGA